MNKALAIMHIYPGASPLTDFQVRDDGEGNTEITVWNLPDPQPTEAELQAAWDDLQANPPAVPLSQEQRIAQLEAEKIQLQQKADEAQQIAAATSTDLQALMDYLAGQGVI